MLSCVFRLTAFLRREARRSIMTCHSRAVVRNLTAIGGSKAIGNVISSSLAESVPVAGSSVRFRK